MYINNSGHFLCIVVIVVFSFFFFFQKLRIIYEFNNKIYLYTVYNNICISIYSNNFY